MSADLKALFAGKEVLADGETMTIKPFPFGKWPVALEKVAGLLPFVEAGDLIGLASAGGERVIELMMLATGKPREWFDTLDPGAGIDILAALVEVNRDFFEQKVRPHLEALFPRAKSSITETSSESSSDTGTPGMPSKDTP